MAASRSVRVVLSAQVQGYIDGMNKAANSTKQVTGESAKLAAQRESFQQLGGAMSLLVVRSLLSVLLR